MCINCMWWIFFTPKISELFPNLKEKCEVLCRIFPPFFSQFLSFPTLYLSVTSVSANRTSRDNEDNSLLTLIPNPRRQHVEPVQRKRGQRGVVRRQTAGPWDDQDLSARHSSTGQGQSHQIQHHTGTEPVYFILLLGADPDLVWSSVRWYRYTVKKGNKAVLWIRDP